MEYIKVFYGDAKKVEEIEHTLEKIFSMEKGFNQSMWEISLGRKNAIVKCAQDESHNAERLISLVDRYFPDIIKYPVGLYLREIAIQNFRKINNIQLKNFAKLNVFLGPNNTGKTSILEAIYLFYFAISKHPAENPTESLSDFIMSRSKFKRLSLASFLMYNSIPFRITGTLRTTRTVGILGESYEVRYTAPQELLDKKAFALSGNTVNTFHKPLTSRHCYLSPSSYSRLNLNKSFKTLERKGLTKTLILPYLEKHGIQDIRFVPFDYYEGEYTVGVVEKDDPRPIPLPELGAGLRALITLLAVLNNNDVVMLDDVESIFHPDIIPEISRILFESRAQVFMTTQNIDLIKELLQKYAINTRVFYFYPRNRVSQWSGEEAKELLDFHGDIR